MSQQMNEIQPRESLTRFDWFGIISGVIGLIADVIAISSVLIMSQKGQDVSTALWLISFVGIIYTTFVVSFYARRVFTANHKLKGGELTPKSQKTIDSGSAALTIVVGGALFFAFLFSVLAQPSPTPATDIPNIPDKHFADMVLASIFVILPFSLFMSFVISVAARRAYAAFDPDYDEEFFF
ncbi:MAG: hypothetical protein ABW250_26840 [Pyrinomonadaceae bacterium]